MFDEDIDVVMTELLVLIRGAVQRTVHAGFHELLP